MTHEFMEKLAKSLCIRGISVLRFNFPFGERGGWPPDPQPLLMASALAALETAKEEAGDLPLIAGGKSLGARIISLAAREVPSEALRGLVFFGYPLHSEKTFTTKKGSHLLSQPLPQLFCSGTRDRLSLMEHLQPFVRSVGRHAELISYEGADHGFRFRKKDPSPPSPINEILASDTVDWMGRILGWDPVDFANPT